MAIEKQMVFIFIGPPGSGKGTQAKLLLKKFSLEYIEIGQLLRDYQFSDKLKASDSSNGIIINDKDKNFTKQKLVKVMNRGDLVPSFLVIKLWLHKLEEFKNIPNLKGFILDGAPRILIEANILNQALEWYQWDKKAKIIFINISKQESIWRLSKRKICQNCKRAIPYLGKLRFIKKCDQCGGSLKIRADENASVVLKRLENFVSQTLPVVNFYKKQKRLIEINGQQSIEEVFQEILRKLELS